MEIILYKYIEGWYFTDEKNMMGLNAQGTSIRGFDIRKTFFT